MTPQDSFASPGAFFVDRTGWRSDRCAQSDWPAVKAIYEQGIATRNATFETEAPAWEDWDAGHLAEPRLVAERDGEVVALGGALADLAPGRATPAWSRTASTWTRRRAARGSAGRSSASSLAQADAAGIWTVQTSIFPENAASVALHQALRLPRRRHARADRADGRRLAGHRAAGEESRLSWVKVEAVVIRERIETVIDAVEEHAGHVGVTVIEAVGHGRQRGITHEYRGRVFESRFLPKALLVFVAPEERVDAIVETIVDAARSGNESGDGIVWTTPIANVMHNRTGRALEEVEVAA